jgi:hypothetical protein
MAGSCDGLYPTPTGTRMQPLEQTIRQYVTQLHALTTGRLSRARLTQMQAVFDHLGAVLQQASALWRGRVDLTDDLWPEADDEDNEENATMDQKERARLLCSYA